MKIVLDHENTNRTYILNHNEYTLEEIIRLIAKLLLMGFEIQPSFGLSSEDVAGILVKCYGFTLEINEEPSMLEQLDYEKLDNFTENQLFRTDLDYIWDDYMSPNTDMLKEEIKNNENGLSVILYKELCTVLREIQDKLFFEVFYGNIKGDYKWINTD